MRYLLLAGTMLLAGPALADPMADLKAVQDEAYTYILTANPIFGSVLGLHARDDSLGDPSLAEADRQTEHLTGILKKLDGIPDAGLTPAGRTEKAIVHRNLADQIEGNRYVEREFQFGNAGGWYSQFADLPLQLRFTTRADFENWIKRLEAVPDVCGGVGDGQPAGPEGRRRAALSGNRRHRAPDYRRGHRRPGEVALLRTVPDQAGEHRRCRLGQPAGAGEGGDHGQGQPGLHPVRGLLSHRVRAQVSAERRRVGVCPAARRGTSI